VINLVILAAIAVYVVGGMYTIHRLKRVERYFNTVTGTIDNAPLLVYLACMFAWPTMLPTIVISTRRDNIP
jgi:hypothetical protein